ncbi:MAG: hypothetical protein HC895_27175 [Leptolyngbyaceae cyanobacterium SM1_3_5]|nr:hypothetical protein [Leptolyngbyaceae cyanobacterium SM1_3_5]
MIPAYLPMSRGFEHQYGHYFGALDYFTHIRDGDHDWYRNQVELKEEGYATELIAKEACKLIGRQEKIETALSLRALQRRPQPDAGS